ncbi:MAG: ATP-binding cassette domain-containing protein [Bacteroidales bacterium]|jgi:ABC-type Fe3+/spermidine/putrescine transport system ATPase subunit|nr:ATP-binding cassette domain-containing protein [Bacteroidales bacterium]
MLELRNISKRIGDFVLEDISFNVSKGDYFVLLGVSGAGKTMLLEIIAGLRNTDKGNIILDGLDITNIRANKRGVGLVFQDSAIFPHLNVAKNIAYSLHGKGLTKAEIQSRVIKWAETVNIENLLERQSNGLSGGEKRRVALARTLAMEPDILLLDEPLSSLDVLLQYDMIRLLKQINTSGKTIMHVTHDYNEAYSLARTLAIINSGKIEQLGLPEEIFKNPYSKFVSAMTGIRNFFVCHEIQNAGKLYKIRIKEGLSVFSSEYCAPGNPFFIREDEISFTNQDINIEENIIEGIITDIFPSPEFYSVVVDAGVNFYVRVKKQDMKLLSVNIGGKIRVQILPEVVIPVKRDTT